MRKTLLTVIYLLAAAGAMAQNEFANKAFYDALNKLYADGQQGFPNATGIQNGSLGSFYKFHHTKTMLPGADSGKIAQPVSLGEPSAIFYFKSSVRMADVKATEAKLAEAIKTGYGKPLYVTKKTDTVKQFIFYRTYYHTNANNIFDNFETYTVLEKGRYLLSLTIHGKNAQAPVKKLPAPEEPQLEQKLKKLLASMDALFADEKGKETAKTQYYTSYESNSTLYGIKYSLKERPFEISCSFNLSGNGLGSVTQAKNIFEKIKAIFVSTGRFAFKNENIEGSRVWLFASEANATAVKSKFSLVLEYYGTENYPSVGFLITRKK